MKLHFAIIASFMLAGCSNPQVREDSANINSPDWFEEALAREVNIEISNELTIPELSVAQNVLGNFELKNHDSDDGSWYFAADLGGDVALVECYIYSSFDGAANALHNLVDYELDYTADLYDKPVRDRTNYRLSADMFGKTPYIALDTSYGIESAAGILKVISARTADNLVVCLHNEIGYNNTFLSLAESFVDAIEQGNAKQNENENTFFETVFLLLINDMRVGFARERYSFDADGDIKSVRDQSFAIPVDASSVARSDIFDIEWSSPDGSLINSTVYSVENGEEKHNLSLGVSDGDWQVEGWVQGKEVKSKLSHNDWILSNHGMYLAQREALVSQEPSPEYVMWLASADPGSVTGINLETVTDNPAANMSAQIGPLRIENLVNEDGTIQQATVNQGPIGMVLTNAYVFGAPVQ